MVSGRDRHVADRDRRRRDELPPRRVARRTGRVNVLLGARLDQRAVGDRAAGVDTPATDPDPVRRRLGLARGVLRGGRNRPVAADRVEQFRALLERALAVTEPVCCSGWRSAWRQGQACRSWPWAVSGAASAAPAAMPAVVSAIAALVAAKRAHIRAPDGRSTSRTSHFLDAASRARRPASGSERPSNPLLRSWCPFSAARAHKAASLPSLARSAYLPGSAPVNTRVHRRVTGRPRWRATRG